MSGYQHSCPALSLQDVSTGAAEIAGRAVAGEAGGKIARTVANAAIDLFGKIF